MHAAPTLSPIFSDSLFARFSLSAIRSFAVTARGCIVVSRARIRRAKCSRNLIYRYGGTVYKTGRARILPIWYRLIQLVLLSLNCSCRKTRVHDFSKSVSTNGQFKSLYCERKCLTRLSLFLSLQYLRLILLKE